MVLPTALIRATSSLRPRFAVASGDSSRAAVMHGSYRIALAELEPYPFSSRAIQPGDYRATFVVTRR